MKTLFDWFTGFDTATRLQLLETAAYFDPAEYNSVFEKELDDLLERVNDEEARQQILALQGFDWSAYILNSLKRAGIRDDDSVQEDFHRTVVRLLVNPGKLFAGWEPGKHGLYPAAFVPRFGTIYAISFQSDGTGGNGCKRLTQWRWQSVIQAKKRIQR